MKSVLYGSPIASPSSAGLSTDDVGLFARSGLRVQEAEDWKGSCKGGQYNKDQSNPQIKQSLSISNLQSSIAFLSPSSLFLFRSMTR